MLFSEHKERERVVPLKDDAAQWQGEMTPKQRLEVVMQIRLVPELHELLRQDAEAVGVSVSTWIRMVLIQSCRDKLGVQARPQQKAQA